MHHPYPPQTIRHPLRQAGDRTRDPYSAMRIGFRLLLLALFSLSLAACHFKEPVFTEGFAKVDPLLNGVWATDGTDSDPRKIEFAVCAPLDDGRYLIHY